MEEIKASPSSSVSPAHETLYSRYTVIKASGLVKHTSHLIPLFSVCVNRSAGISNQYVFSRTEEASSMWLQVHVLHH